MEVLIFPGDLAVPAGLQTELLASPAFYLFGGILCRQRSIQRCYYNISATRRVGVRHPQILLALERKAVEAELRVLYRQDCDTLEASLVCILAYG